MKTIFLTVCAFFAFAVASAQRTPDELQNDNDDIQDKLQQEPPLTQQRRIENAATPTTPKAQNAKDNREAEERLRKERERSTGKESKNPAIENTTITPTGKLSEPDSKPLKQN